VRVDKLRGEWQALHDQVVKAGGLHIIGTERHESRRIDNQLRGRSGRQATGQLALLQSLEDPLLRIFAGERINRIMVMLKMPEGEAIEHPMVTRSIESAQRKVEARNFDIRSSSRVRRRQQRPAQDHLRPEERSARASDVSSRITDLRSGVLNDMFRMYVPTKASRSSGTSPASKPRSRPSSTSSCRCAAGLKPNPICRTRPCSRASSRKRRRPTPPSCRPAPRLHSASTSVRHAADPRRALARAPLGARSPAPGNPSARLRAEKPEAGIQAEAFELFRRHDRGGQARGHQDADRGGDPHAGGHQADDQAHIENVRTQHPSTVGVDEESAYDGNGDVAIAEAATKKKAQPTVRHTQKVGRNDPCPAARARKQALPRQAD